MTRGGGMQIILTVTWENDEVAEVNARRLLDWRKNKTAKKTGRVLEDKFIGENKRIIVREFIVDVDDYTDDDIVQYNLSGEG